MTEKRQNEIWAMLTQSEKEDIKEVYNVKSEDDWDRGYDDALESIFGLHNITAQAGEKLKEPKFNIGEKVRISCYSNGEVWDAVMHNKIVTIQDYYVKDGVNMYVLKEGCRDFGEHCLEPYTEPKEEETGEEREISEKFPIDYAQYRLDLAKEIAVAMVGKWSNADFIPHDSVQMAKEIVRRLKEMEDV